MNPEAYTQETETETEDTTPAAQEAAKQEAEEKQRAAVEETLEEKLNKVFSDDDSEVDDDDEEHEDPKTEDQDTDDSQTDEDQDEDSDNTDDDTKDDTAAEAAAEDTADDAEQPSDAPTLPAAYRRSLYAYDWTDDEIDQNLRHYGDSFIKTAERIHNNRNTEMQQWAEAGRRAREESDQSPDSSQDSQQPTRVQSGDLPDKLEAIDTDALKKQYGDDEVIDAVAGPVNKVIDALNTVLPQVQQGQQAVQQAEIERVEQQVESFFGSEDLKPYSDMYGDSNQGLTDEQINARNQVLDTAFNLSYGAKELHGKELPLAEALKSAHDMVAKDKHVAAAKSSVKKQAKQRQRGISQKPSKKTGSSPAGSSGKPQTREELEDRVGNKLQQVFNR